MPKLVIVGSSSFTDAYVDSLQAQGAGDADIIFTGELSGSILGELYSNASVFVQASEDEGISLALLEALSYGCPVLVSDIAGNKEIVSCLGCMFKSTDISDLARKLKVILTHEHSAGTCAKIYQTQIREKYNIEETSLHVAGLYGNMVPALS
jgi:glycosyltransferase involved in cell wall biosynthesis